MSKKEGERRYDLLLPRVVELRLVPAPPEFFPVFDWGQQCIDDDAV